MTNIGNMFKKIQDLQIKMKDLENKIQNSEYTSSVGGGSVKVTIDGKGTIKKLFIEPSLCSEKESETISELIILAINSAKSEAEKEKEKELKQLTGGLTLPPGFSLPF
tara:strand:- start:15 stop:338 length:324 start_codon:yes stop_codon:yes gene_type:complete